MFASFIKHYLELPETKKNVVCLGGGVGTSQVLKGLRKHNLNITAIVSMADDGGSAGRLRRAFAVPPPGDLVNCLAALSKEESILKDLFVYRFAGKRHGKDTDIGGQKLGNLIFVALTDIFGGDTNRALEEFSRIISSKGRVLPATVGDVNIWAKTIDGKKVFGEQNIDLGKYNGSRTLKEVHLTPPEAKAYKPSLDSISAADGLVIGPGDVFSTVLPVLIVPKIKERIIESKAHKILVINIANKPFETNNFRASEYVKTIESHLGRNPFDTILVNINQKPKIPVNLKYQYVEYDKENFVNFHSDVVGGNFINDKFPLYHDSVKIADAILKILK